MANIDSIKEIKIILVGDCGAGKTCLINVAVGLEFPEEIEPTISNSFFRKEIEYKNKEYSLIIWDTIGSEKLRNLNKIFYKGSKIVIFVYDITKENALEDFNFWIKEIKNQLDEKKFVLAICGNKSDLYYLEKVPEADGRNVADSMNAKFKLTSAKSNKEDFSVFLEELAHDYIDNILPFEDNDNNVYKLGKENKKSCIRKFIEKHCHGGNHDNK